MNGLTIYGGCELSLPRCWTPAHRVFLTKHQQILQKAIEVFGTRELAVSWLTNQALGLGHQVPCTLLARYESFEHVCDFLCRLEYGVYT